MIWQTDNLISVGWVIWIIIIGTTSSSILCDSGDCIFDCTTQNCKEIVCTDTADSCTIHCGESDCYQSMFYLSATVNTVDCTGSDSCKSAHFYCGIPDRIPFGFSDTNFDGHINSCVFTLAQNAMSDHGRISCNHDIDLCSVQTQSDNDDFKESTFECETSPVLSQCALQCYNAKSCGSETSHFICNSPHCECTDRDGDICTDYIHQNMNDITVTQTTISPPTSSPTHATAQSTQYTPRTTTTSVSPVTSQPQNTTFPSIAPTISPTTNNKIIAVAPTRPLTVASHIYSTLIRKERVPTIQSTTPGINDETNESENLRMISVYTPSTWTKICVGLFCGILVFCSLSAAGCYKIYKQQRMEFKVPHHKQARKVESLSNEMNDCKSKEYKASTIDLGVVHVESSGLDVNYKGEEVSIELDIDGMDGLYDVNLNDDDETSDDETLSGDGNPYETISNAVDALCNMQSIEIAPVSIYNHASLVINQQQMKIVPLWNSEDESDDELEEMYSDPCIDGNGYSNETLCTPQSTLETSVAMDLVAPTSRYTH